MDRRAFLKGAMLAASGAWIGDARALGPGQQLRLTNLRHDGSWQSPRGALEVLGEELRYRTSIDVANEPFALRADDPRMARNPMVILSGMDEFRLRPKERQRLKLWLEMGGFLVVDDSTEGSRSPFVDSVKRELQGLFPRTPIERISPEHVVFRSFYRLDYPAGQVIRRPHLEGLRMGRRFSVVINHNNLLGALARDGSGRFLNTPSPGGENQREMAIRFGINLVMYATCLHYKDDQVHLDYLLRRRKWRIQRPDQ